MVMYKMMSYINMFRAHMIFIILGDGYGRLVVAKQSGGMIKWSGDLSEEGM